MMTVSEQPAASPKLNSALFILLICAAIAACEWIFAYLDVTYGIIMALFLALGVYLALPFIKLGQLFTDSAESLVLIPLYILFTSSLPWFFLSQELVLPSVYAAVLALCAWHIYHKNISLRGIGFRNENIFRNMMIGFLVGVPMGIAEYFIITPVATYPAFEIKYLIRDVFYMIFFVGLGEELLFRGLIQRDLENLLGWKWGLLFASVMFGVMHLTWRSVPELGFTTAAGLIFGYLYHKTDNLAAPIIAHGVGNAILVAVMPYIFLK